MTRLPAPAARVLDAALEGTVALSFSKIGYLVRSRTAGWEDPAEGAAAGRRVLITGANSGLGYATARQVLEADGQVRFTVRSEQKGQDTIARLSGDLGRDVSPNAAFDVVDLADLSSVRTFAQQQLGRDETIHSLVHNAGALFAERSETVDGFEQTYQVHVVAPFLLTSLLLPSMMASAPSRVITVTSGGMYAEKLIAGKVDSPGGYRGTTAYARAKRAQVTLTREWARRFGGRGVGFHTVHPGWALTPGVESSLPGFRKLMGPVLRDPSEGADTIAWLSLQDEVAEDGRLWHDRRPRWEHKVPWTREDPGESDRLWDRVRRDAGADLPD